MLGPYEEQRAWLIKWFNENAALATRMEMRGFHFSNTSMVMAAFDLNALADALVDSRKKKDSI